MKAFSKIMALVLVALLGAAAPATAANPEIDALREEIKALKTRMLKLEKRLLEASQGAGRVRQAAEAASADPSKPTEALAMPEKTQPRGLLSEAGKRIKIYGAVELEASFERMSPKQGRSSDKSELSLSKGEVFFEARINQWAKGVLHFLWEQGKTEPVDLDEGFILLGQTEDIPFYFLGGRIYPAIGLFETYLVSDPITQNVFETQAAAGEIGYASDWINFGAGVYNAGAAESGDAPDDRINTYYARVQFQTPEGALGGVGLSAGAAYTNNIAGAGTIADWIPGGVVKDLVGGLSVMASLQWGVFAFTGEYITALDDFQAGELNIAGGRKASPSAYNLELAVMPFVNWTFAVRYEGSEDLFSSEPERQWGLGAAWAFLPDTTLKFEYLRGEYKNEDARDLFTTQLAVAF